MNPRPSRETHPTGSAPPAVALLKRRTRDLKHHLAAAVAGADDGVHQARVASRRLREAVPVLATGLDGVGAAKAGRKIRRLTRALGDVRELDVTLHLLNELAQNKDVSRAAVEDVRSRVVGERDRMRATMIKRLGRVDQEKLDRRLEALAASLWSEPSEPWREALAARAAKRANRLKWAMQEAGQMYSTEFLHQVRIASKKLRYALEIAADSHAADAAKHVRALKRVQEMLGEMHDLQVLQTHVAAVQAGGGPPGTGTSQGLNALARLIEDRCRHLHGRYIAATPSLRAVVEAASTTIVNELARGRRRRPLKMGLARTARHRAAGGR